MPVDFNLRSLVHQRRWEEMAAAPITAAAGVTLVSPHWSDPFGYMLLFNRTTAYIYSPAADAWQAVAAPALAGTFGAGACACWNPNGPTGTVSAATANSITTNYTANRSLYGYTIRLLTGTGAGQERVIAYNPSTANTTFTVTQNWTVQPDATTTWVIRSGRFYVLGVGTLAAGSFRYFDVASNAWTSLSITNLPTTWGTGGALASPCCATIATGTATAGGASTLTNSGKNWTVNQWTNMQIRIMSGAGAGQIRNIASNTATVITVSVAWITQPDNTSVYQIEPGENFIYLVGNNTPNGMWRYSISANTWTSLTPSPARSGLSNTAVVPLIPITEEPLASWNDETNILNGRILYSNRGGVNGIDYYDTALNAWTNGVSFNGSAEDYTSASHVMGYSGKIFAILATGRASRFSPGTAQMEPWSTVTATQGSSSAGIRAGYARFVGDKASIHYIYTIVQGSTRFLRAQEIF